MLDLICPPHLAMGSTHNWSRVLAQKCRGCVVKCGGMYGQVQGFAWSSAWVCVHHVFSYLWASDQVGGLCYFSNSHDVVDFT
jgi:hypothetical protein